MRARRSGQRLSVVMAVALFATVLQLYAMLVFFQRELERLEASANSRASAALALVQQMPTAVPVPTATPTVAQTPHDALGRALSAAVEVMRDPGAARMPLLQRVADAGFISAYQREIDHLKNNGLRLSPRSGFHILRVEQVAGDGDGATFVTEERWVYEEETTRGEVVRCLVETSSQRYQVERRAAGWVVAQVTLAGNPRRQPCGDLPETMARVGP